MSAAAVLFDHRYRGDVWRLEVSTHGGQTFLNWRRWFWSGDTLRPTKEGTTIPLERLAELHAALGAYLVANDSVGLPSAA